jgi:trehalose synthase
VVVLYDPQTIGLAPELKRLGATVVWSCHVGIDQPNDLARTAWEFLRPYVQAADAYVFSRPAYCWEGLDRDRMAVIPPCIDAFAPKNQPLATPAVNAILQAAGILDAPEGDRPAPMFQHLDGSPGRVVRRAEMIQDEPIPPGVPIVLRVSRLGSAQGPAGRRPGVHRPRPDRLGAYLVLAGPAVTSVSDDPESEQVLQQVRRAAAALPTGARARLHLACLPWTTWRRTGHGQRPAVSGRRDRPEEPGRGVRPGRPSPSGGPGQTGRLVGRSAG